MIAQRMALTADADTAVPVIVLGCTVMPDGSPSDWLSDRLLATLQLVSAYQQQQQLHHDADVTLEIICSGAAVRSTVAEASCMRNWLSTELTRTSVPFRASRTAELAFACDAASEATAMYWESPVSQDGAEESTTTTVPKRRRVTVRIVEEASATDTPENLMYSLRYLTRRRPSTQTLQLGGDQQQQHLWLVTSDFHLVRGATLCRNEISFAMPGVLPFFVLENNRVLQFASEDPSLAEAVARGQDDADPRRSSIQTSHGGAALSVLVHCLAAPTPTLAGDLLEGRRQRERMLLPEDIARQRLQHVRVDSAGNGVHGEASHNGGLDNPSDDGKYLSPFHIIEI